MVSSAICQIFYEFLIFYNLFHEPLSRSNMRNRQTSEVCKIFVNIARSYCAIEHREICKDKKTHLESCQTS